MDTLRQQMSGRRVLVVGSAPGTMLPAPGLSDYVIVVNGGIATVTDRPIDLALINGRSYSKGSYRHWTPARRRLHEAMLAQYANRCVTSVGWIVKRSHHETRSRLAGLWFVWEHEYEIDIQARRQIERESGAVRPGDNMAPISAGLWGACFALGTDAAHVELHGFSLSDGYAYIDGLTPGSRGHIKPDLRALKNLALSRCSRLSIPALQKVHVA